MPLNFTPKGKSNPTAPQPAAPTARPQVNYGAPPTSTARVNALKEKLSQKPVANPVAPRRAGSTARAEEFSKLQKYTPQQPVPVAQKAPATSARAKDPDLSRIAPPPSGLSEAAKVMQTAETTQPLQNIETPEDARLSQIDNSAEPISAAEANNEPISPQFVALAKKEKAIRRSQQDLKAQMDAFEATKAEYVRKSELKANALKVLTEAGVTYDDLVKLQLDQADPDPQQPLLDKIAALEAKLAGVDEQFANRDKQQYDAALNQIRSDATLLVDSDPAFETIKATGETEAIVELITGVFNEEGIVLSVEEAAREIEDKLVEREFKRLETLSKLQKIKSRMAPPAEIPEEANTPEATAPQTQTTLTNRGTSQRPLSARERGIAALERAMAAKG